jgi:hypothetical protein
MKILKGRALQKFHIEFFYTDVAPFLFQSNQIFPSNAVLFLLVFTILYPTLTGTVINNNHPAPLYRPITVEARSKTLV